MVRITTEEIRQQIEAARVELMATDMPADRLSLAFDGVMVRQMALPRGTWVVE